VLIGVSSLEKSRSFYEVVFGMKFEEFRPPFALAVLDGVEFNLEEDATYRKANWAQMYIGGRKHISFETDKLTEFLALARSNGAVIVQDIESKPWGWDEAIISDPDGNEFIIEQESTK